MRDEEDYWNTSEIPSFIFDDQETDITSNSIFGISKAQTSNILSQIQSVNRSDTVSVISSGSSSNSHVSFENICLPKAAKEFKIVLDPVLAVKQLVGGEKIVLEVFTSLDSKTKLLDAALLSNDTDVVIHVLDFLRKSLSNFVLQKILMDFPLAASAYVQLLAINNETSNAVDFLTMLGHFEDAAMMNYQELLKKKLVSSKVKSLRHCATSYDHLEDLKYMNTFAELLELQQPIAESDLRVQAKEMKHGKPLQGSKFYVPPAGALVGSSIVSTLRYCSKHHYGLSENNFGSPKGISNRFGVSSVQYMWSVACGRCSVGAFPDILQLVTAKSLFGSAKLLISVEPLMKLMSHYGATSDQLEQCLKFVESPSDRIMLAKHFNCVTVAVDTMIGLGDRQALQRLKEAVKSNKERLMYVDAALRLSVKWKN